jgi:hypothetical protein
MRTLPFFKTLDEKIFEQCKKWQESPNFQQLNQKILSLDEPLKYIIQKSIIGLLFFIPLSCLLFSFFFLYQKHSMISDKKILIEQIATLSDIVNAPKELEHSLVSPLSINSDQDIMQLIQNTHNLKNTASKISFEELFKEPYVPGLSQINVQLTFNKLSSPELSSIMTLLYEQLKIRIQSVSVDRDNALKLLKGKIALNFYSK